MAGPYQPGTPDRDTLITLLQAAAPACVSIAYTAYEGQDELVAMVEAGDADVVIDYLMDVVRKGKKVLAGPIRTDIKSLVW